MVDSPAVFSLYKLIYPPWRPAAKPSLTNRLEILTTSPAYTVTARIQSPWIISRALPDLSCSLICSYFNFAVSLHHIRTHLIRQQTLSSFSPAVSLHSCFLFTNFTHPIPWIIISHALHFFFCTPRLIYFRFNFVASLHHIRTTFHPWAGSFHFHRPFRFVFNCHESDPLDHFNFAAPFSLTSSLTPLHSNFVPSSLHPIRTHDYIKS